MVSHQFVAGGLRASTLGLRFMLMLFLARSLSLELLGLFGLYWAALQLASSLVGLDVYAHTSRLLLKREVDKGKVVSLHFGLVFVAIFVIEPLAATIFSNSSDTITPKLTFLFVIHLPFEVISTEIGRLLIPLGKPFVSTVIIFLRSAVWIIPLIIGMEMHLLPVDLEYIILFWVLGSTIGTIIACIAMGRTLGKFTIPSVSFEWVRNALAASGLFLMATIVFRSILGLDRFMVEDVLGIEIVGIYALFSSISLGVLSLIESGVSAWRYPSLVNFIQCQDVESTKSQLRIFIVQNSLATLGLMSSISILFVWAMYFFLDDVYFDNVMTFFIIVSGVTLYCLSMPFHYIVYGFRNDLVLLAIYTCSLMIMIVWAYFFMGSFGIEGAAIMLFLALGTIFATRIIAACFLLNRFTSVSKLT